MAMLHGAFRRRLPLGGLSAGGLATRMPAAPQPCDPDAGSASNAVSLTKFRSCPAERATHGRLRDNAQNEHQDGTPDLGDGAARASPERAPGAPTRDRAGRRTAGEAGSGATTRTGRRI